MARVPRTRRTTAPSHAAARPTALVHQRAVAHVEVDVRVDTGVREIELVERDADLAQAATGGVVRARGDEVRARRLQASDLRGIDRAADRHADGAVALQHRNGVVDFHDGERAQFLLLLELESGAVTEGVTDLTRAG